MIIAIDYDGTIADTNREKADWIKSNLGLEVPAFNCNRTDCVPIIGAAVYQEMSDWVYEHAATMQAAPLPGAVQAVRNLAMDNLLYVVTARTQRRTDFARQWLEKNGLLACVKEIRSADTRTKTEIGKEIKADVMIDDDIRHLAPPPPPQWRRILLMAGRTGRIPDNADDSLIRCRDWKEILINVRTVF